MQADDLLVAVSVAVKRVMVSARELGYKVKDYAQYQRRRVGECNGPSTLNFLSNFRYKNLP